MRLIFRSLNDFKSDLIARKRGHLIFLFSSTRWVTVTNTLGHAHASCTTISLPLISAVEVSGWETRVGTTSQMESDDTFLDRVLGIVKQERGEDVPLIDFKHPTELEAILDLDTSAGVSDDELEKCVRQILRYSVKTNKYTFKNQLYGPTDPYGLSGAWIVDAFNTIQQTFEVAPAFTLIELKILQRILNLFGLSRGDGTFSPGGSISLFYGIVAARYKAFPEVKSKGMRGLPELIIFTSADSHYSVNKAANWLGFGTDNIRFIDVNEKGQMLTAKLDEAILKEKETGRFPLFVNATAGTTVLGAIDDLEAVTDVCQRHGVWMHVDACWGGSLILSPEHRAKLRGIERANSISWNPHKMLSVPLQCSVFLVREKGLLLEANCSSAAYLFQKDKFYDTNYDTGDKSVQCGRKVDAFKLWIMWKARGDNGLAQLVDRVMDNAQFCLRTIAKRPGFRLVSDVLQCPNVCFWYIPSFMRDKTEDDKWWDLMHKVTPKIKELLTLSSKMLLAYSPLRRHKNFFRLAITCHPPLEHEHMLELIRAVELCGEMVTSDMISL